MEIYIWINLQIQIYILTDRQIDRQIDLYTIPQMNMDPLENSSSYFLMALQKYICKLNRNFLNKFAKILNNLVHQFFRFGSQLYTKFQSSGSANQKVIQTLKIHKKVNKKKSDSCVENKKLSGKVLSSLHLLIS